jgi:radical SAM-linked protein
MSFGPPLPLGESGEHELLDIITTAPVGSEIAGINRYLPEGLAAVRSVQLQSKPDAVSASMTAGRYLVALPQQVREHAQKRIDSFLFAGECKIQVERKGETITRDIRLLVHDIKLSDAGGNCAIEAVLSMAPGRVCRPRELIPALFPGTALSEFFISRMECLGIKAGILVPLTPKE